MPGTPVLLALGIGFASVLIALGLQLRYRERHHWIAGYNRASAEEKREYDIVGLSHHLGNGLTMMGVALSAMAIAAAFEHWTAGAVALGFFLFFAAITVIGGQKFLPRRPGVPVHLTHRLAKRLLPARAYRAMERGTRQWRLVCPECGSERDYWDAGGIRWKAVGERREYQHCEPCDQGRWHRVQRKQAA